MSAWSLEAHVACGTAHVAKSLPCQDSCAAKVIGNRLFVAMADGAGTARLADVAASRAVEKSMELAEQWLAKPFVTKLKKPLLLTANLVRATLEELAIERMCRLEDLATTYLLAVAETHFVAAVHVGDGALVVRDADDETRSICWSDREGKAANVTTFLTARDYYRHLKVRTFYGNVAGVAAMTDGVELQCVGWRDGLCRPKFFTPLFRWMAGLPEDARAAEIRSLVESDCRRKTSDDCTLVVAVPSHVRKTS